MVCFLAYVLWKSLAQWMKRPGLGDAPRTLLEEFSKIKRGEIALLTHRRGAGRGKQFGFAVLQHQIRHRKYY